MIQSEMAQVRLQSPAVEKRITLMRIVKRHLVVLFWCAFALSANALEFRTGLMFSTATDYAKSTTAARNWYPKFTGGIYHSTGDVEVLWDLSVDTEGKYPEEFLAGLFGPLSVDIGEAGIRYKGSVIGLSAGRFVNTDMVDSPYALFISGAGNKALMGEVSVQHGKFFFVDRWVGLNYRLNDSQDEEGKYLYSTSAMTSNIYRDRGMVYKAYGVDFGRLRLGFQDVLIFTGEYFNVNAFANPAPGYYVQYVASALGRPWTSEGDMNSILGFFVDYKAPNWYAYAQVLIDDLNFDFDINPSDYTSPSKVAFSLGGSLDTKAGVFGAYLAGATRYTFESVRNEYYSYTYYPGSAVNSDNQLVGVPVSDMMIGYVNGENNIAAMLTWKKKLPLADVSTRLEFKLTGEQSPANPWHDGEDWTQGTRWLDDPVLEKKLTLRGNATRSFGRFSLLVDGTIGYVWNRLELTAATNGDSSEGDDSSEPMWRPSGDSGPIGAISVSVKYTFPL